MDWKKVTDRAKQMIDKRGGTASLKEDAQELRDIAREPGPAGDKVKAAAEALREPGAPGQGSAEPPGGEPPAEQPPGEQPPGGGTSAS